MKIYEATNRFENTMTYSITFPADINELIAFKDKRLYKTTGKTIILRGKDKHLTSNEIEIEYLRLLTTIKMVQVGEEVVQETIKLSPEPVIGKVLT